MESVTVSTTEKRFRNYRNLISGCQLYKRSLYLLSVVPHYFMKRRLQMNRITRGWNCGLRSAPYVRKSPPVTLWVSFSSPDLAENENGFLAHTGF